jgi:hypothetical protein
MDMDTKKLHFFSNGRYCGVGFENVDDEELYPAVYLYQNSIMTLYPNAVLKDDSFLD